MGYTSSDRFWGAVLEGGVQGFRQGLNRRATAKQLAEENKAKRRQQLENNLIRLAEKGLKPTLNANGEIIGVEPISTDNIDEVNKRLDIIKKLKDISGEIPQIEETDTITTQPNELTIPYPAEIQKGFNLITETTPRKRTPTLADIQANIMPNTYREKQMTARDLGYLDLGNKRQTYLDKSLTEREKRNEINKDKVSNAINSLISKDEINKARLLQMKINVLESQKKSLMASDEIGEDRINQQINALIDKEFPGQATKYIIGQIITTNSGKKLEVTGGDLNNDPDVREVK